MENETESTKNYFILFVFIECIVIYIAHMCWILLPQFVYITCLTVSQALPWSCSVFICSVLGNHFCVNVLLQLYAEFSDKFKLSDCSLAIIHCGNYNDGPLVEALWLEIVDKGL